MTPGRRMTQKTAKKIKPAASSEVAWHAAKLRVDRMKGLCFAEARLSYRAVEKFVARNSNTPANSIAQMRAACALDHRARAILRSAPIETPADAIAALRFSHEWYERDTGDENIEKLFHRAIEFLERDIASPSSRLLVSVRKAFQTAREAAGARWGAGTRRGDAQGHAAHASPHMGHPGGPGRRAAVGDRRRPGRYPGNGDEELRPPRPRPSAQGDQLSPAGAGLNLLHRLPRTSW